MANLNRPFWQDVQDIRREAEEYYDDVLPPLTDEEIEQLFQEQQVNEDYRMHYSMGLPAEENHMVHDHNNPIID